MSDRHHDYLSPEGCVFCEIAAGESRASVFYEDDLVLGLMTIGSVTTGHAMVIPKATRRTSRSLRRKPVGRCGRWLNERRQRFGLPRRRATRSAVKP